MMSSLTPPPGAARLTPIGVIATRLLSPPRPIRTGLKSFSYILLLFQKEPLGAARTLHLLKQSERARIDLDQSFNCSASGDALQCGPLLCVDTVEKGLRSPRTMTICRWIC